MMPVLSMPRPFVKSCLPLFIFALFISLLPFTTSNAQSQPSVTSSSARRKANARRAYASRAARTRAARRARLARARRRALGNTTTAANRPPVIPSTGLAQSANQTSSAANVSTRRPDETLMKTSSVAPVGSADGATSATPTALPSIMPLAPSVDPFAAIESADSAGQARDIAFTRTELVAKAKASAKVSLNGQTLLVRMSAKDIPVPTYFDVPRYALWVYVPNYQVKLYIGDLPITPNSRRRGKSSVEGEKTSRPTLGSSESAYRYTALPPGAEFGGLMLTAEPVRYTPIVNEALRPVLVYLTPEVNQNLAVAAPAYYAGPLPESMLEKKTGEPDQQK